MAVMYERIMRVWINYKSNLNASMRKGQRVKLVLLFWRDCSVSFLLTACSWHHLGPVWKHLKLRMTSCIERSCGDAAPCWIHACITTVSAPVFLSAVVLVFSWCWWRCLRPIQLSSPDSWCLSCCGPQQSFLWRMDDPSWKSLKYLWNLTGLQEPPHVSSTD